MATRQHIPGLDGLRAIAALMVLGRHSPWDLWLPQYPFNFGLLGVDLFFVLSGFLITRILIYNREHGVGLSSFYLRRIARIFPVAYLGLLFVWWVWQDSPSAIWAAVYLTNWSRPFYPVQSPHNHYWSLAVEEQFYLIFPLVLLFVPSRRMVWFACGCLVAFTACNVLVIFAEAGNRVSSHMGTYLLHSGTVTRGAALIMGILIACSEGWVRANWRWCMAICVGLVLVHPLFDLVAVFLRGHSPLWMVYGRHLASMCWATMLFIVALHISGTRADWLLANQPIRYVGRISYGLYVYHMPAFWLASIHGPMASDWTHGRVVTALLATFAAAIASHHLIELPIMRFARRHESAIVQWWPFHFRRGPAVILPAVQP